MKLFNNLYDTMIYQYWLTMTGSGYNMREKSEEIANSQLSLTQNSG